MARINTYQNDVNINPDDILLGSDADTSNKRTKNFRVSDLLDYFSQNRTSSGIAYMFGTDPNKRGYFSANSEVLKSVTQLRINAYSKSDTDYTGAFNTFSGQSLFIKIVDINDPSQYAFFDVSQVTKQEKDGFFVMDVNLIGTLGNGKMKDGQSYFLVFAPVQDTPSVTKTSQLENDGEDGENPFISYSDLYTGNAIIRGGYYHVANYDYFVWADRYIINNVTHTNYISQTITLDPSDVDFDRIDVIVINDDETISKITGVPASNPLKPAIDDSTQVEVTFILVKANTVAPDDVENILLYDENLQQLGGEANTAKNSASIDLANTAQAYKGTKSIRYLDSPAGTYTELELGNPFYRNDFDYIVLFIKLINNVNHSIRINFIKTAITNSQGIAITNGKYGFDRLNTTDWQSIVIPREDFNLTAGPYSKIQVINQRSGASFYIDNIFLQKNPSIPNPQLIEKTSDIPLNDGEDGTSRYTEETDFKTVGGQSIIGSGDIPVGGDIYSEPFANTTAMVADPTSQDEDIILVVTDASDDTNLTFPVGETRLQAYYRYLGTTTGTMSDYELISAPYGNHTAGQLTTDELDAIQNANTPSETNPFATMDDLQATVTADTGTSVDMGNVFGNNCNTVSANSNSELTLTNLVPGGCATVKVNRATETTIAAISGVTITKLPANAFVASTDMDMHIYCRTLTQVDYYFLKRS
jgi:hypothetical protein